MIQFVRKQEQLPVEIVVLVARANGNGLWKRIGKVSKSVNSRNSVIAYQIQLGGANSISDGRFPAFPRPTLPLSNALGIEAEGVNDNRMKRIPTRFLPSPIPRSLAIALIAIAWSGAAFCDDIHDAAKSGDLAKVQALVKANPDVLSSKDSDGETPLATAVQNKRADVVAFLISAKADLNAKDTSGMTPLLWAAQWGYTDIAKQLVAAKSDIEAVNGQGDTPLLLAAFQGNTGVAQLLVAAGANVNAKDTSGNTALRFATLNERKKIVQLLKDHGATQ